MTLPLLAIAERSERDDALRTGRAATRPWKRVRPTSVAVYEHLRDSGKLAESRNRVLRTVSALRNRKGVWPTGCEVHAELLERGEVEDANPNRVKPRLSELADGWFVTHVTEVDGKKVRTKVHVPCDVLVRGPKRKSLITRISCITWQVRERK